jgi:Ca-activated chloride channel family protein
MDGQAGQQSSAPRGPGESRTAIPRDGAGGRLVASDGRVLPLRSVALRAEATAGIARTTLQQRFLNSYGDPLRVSYQIPLPVDGALGGYSIRVGERRIVGEVDRLAAARERFEEALVEGRSAGLVEQDRPNLFSQEIGNVPPGAEVVAELLIDQRLAWVPDEGWEWRFPTVVAPRYLGVEGRVPDADRVSVDVVEGGTGVAASAILLVRDSLTPGRMPVSPTHAVRISPVDAGLEVRLRPGPAAGDAAEAGADGTRDAVDLDRDLVVRWATAGPTLDPSLLTARPPAERRPTSNAAYGLLTVVPPVGDRRPPAMPRDLIVLLDTSGSMSGAPLEQARRVVVELVETLTELDRLELIQFSSSPRRWRPRPVRATAAVRQAAREWLAGLQAEGGTEMVGGVREALDALRPGAQRQVVLVTDGLVGFEREIVATIERDLPAGSRLHALAVGAAPNRALTGPAARAGRGTEVLIGLDDDPGPVAARLIAHLRAPLVTDVTLEGSALVRHAPARLPDVYAGAPLWVALELVPGGGELWVRGKTLDGAWEHRIQVPAVEPGEGSPAIVSLYAREAVEDLEMRGASGLAVTDQHEIDQEIERIGLCFQIATRLTSWVAVSEEPAVDPTQPLRRERIPQALPYGLSVEGLGLRKQPGRGLFASARYRILQVQAHPDELNRYDLSRDELWRSIASADLAEAFRALAKSCFEVDDRPYGGRAHSTIPPSSDAAAQPGPTQPVRATRWLSAHLVVCRERDLVLEVDIHDAVDWSPTAAVVIWPGWIRIAAEIVWATTTRPGRIQAGQTLRLTLRLSTVGFTEPPETVRLASEDNEIELGLWLRPPGA